MTGFVSYADALYCVDLGINEPSVAWMRALGVDLGEVPEGSHAVVFPGYVAVPIFLGLNTRYECLCQRECLGRLDLTVPIGADLLPSHFGLVPYSQ